MQPSNLTERDPRVDPKPEDIIQAIASRPAIHVGKFSEITVQAVVGNLIATTSTGDSEIRWQTNQNWLAPSVWISHWEVIHAAD